MLRQGVSRGWSRGLIDGVMDPDHEVFRSGHIGTLRSDEFEDKRPSRQHGTAVAALPMGSSDSRFPGLVPGTRLIAMDSFNHGNQTNDQSDVFALIKALDTRPGGDLTVLR